MSVREYIGARYIPLFADPIDWDIDSSYEPLTVVKYQGASYVSKRSVPEGIELLNTDYWILWADYNAQLEQYRQEVLAFDGRITDLEEGLPVTSYDENATVADAIADALALLPGTDYTSESTVSDAIEAVDSKIRTEAYFFGDSWGYGEAGNQWQPIVCQQLHLNRNNYCIQGSGFITSGTDGKTIYEKINSVEVENPNSVALVVVCALTNDMGNSSATPSTVSTGVKNTCTLLKTKFPRAKILLVPNYRRYETMPANNNIWVYLTQMINGALESGVCVASDSINWLRTHPGYWNPDNIHLINNGYQFWGGCIVNTIIGNNALLSPIDISSMETGWTQKGTMTQVQNGIAYAQWKFANSNAWGSSNTKIATLSDSAPKPSNQIFAPVYLNNNKTLIGVAWLTPEGYIYACNNRGSDVGANSEIYIQFEYATSPYYRSF